MTVNLNDLARDICAAEGGKTEISIAQVKEVLGILGRRWRGEKVVRRPMRGVLIDRPTSLTPAGVINEVNAIVRRAGRRK